MGYPVVLGVGRSFGLFSLAPLCGLAVRVKTYRLGPMGLAQNLEVSLLLHATL